MANIYYHTPKLCRASGDGLVVWSVGNSLTEIGKTLAKHNKIWPDSSSEGQVITIGKKQRGRHGIRPIKEYRLHGDKLTKVAECRPSGFWVRTGEYRIEGLRPSILPSFIYTGEQGRRPQAVVYIKRGTRPQAAGKILFAYLVE